MEKTLHVDRGSQVKKGDLLAEIYDPERDVAVIQGEGEPRSCEGGGAVDRAHI